MMLNETFLILYWKNFFDTTKEFTIKRKNYFICTHSFSCSHQISQHRKKQKLKYVVHNDYIYNLQGLLVVF